MKRASYREAVAWIALNDEPCEHDPEEISNLISVSLISDLFRIPRLKMAMDIIAYRKKNLK